MDNISKLEKEARRRTVENWEKPLAKPRAVPKSEPKKRGRPKKEAPLSDDE